MTYHIVGLGLMGGSYAAALAAAGHRVTAEDRDPAALAWAEENGLIAAGAAQNTASLVAGAGCVVLALYPADILPWLRENAGHLAPGAFVTDLAGVKAPFLAEAQALLRHNEFIACHPMAGREKSGVQNASGDLLRDANFLITPTEHNTPEGIAFAEALAHTLGAGRVTRLSPGEHDSLIAYVSQLTHAIAISLMNANDDALLPAVTGDSFRDLTRIAEMNDELWSELFLQNTPALTAQIDAFSAALGEVRAALQAGDKAALQALMQTSTRRRRGFNQR